jgi:ubiquinone/menaquinone biosynthesis C-methylase UbiE
MEYPVNNQADEDQAAKNDMEKMVSSYDSYMRKITFGRESNLRDITVKLAHVSMGDTVLEVGCGTGTLTLAVKRQVGPAGKVFGIDIIPGMIEASQRKAAVANEKITFQLGSIDAIPFPASRFDVVICSFTIFHMSDETRQKGIAEIFRVLKPNGHLFVLDIALPARPFPRAIAKVLLGFMITHKLEELIPLMKESGFSDIEMMSVNFRILGLSLLAGITGKMQKN